jgi:hypothetical protein
MKLGTQRRQLPVLLRAGATYFALVFGAGFIFGSTRILCIVPRFGVRIAELMEAPLMLIVIILAAKWVVRKFQVAAAVSERLAVGLLALSLMVALEFTLVLKLRGLTLAEYFRERDPVSGTVYYLMLGVFAVMPLPVGHKECHTGDA